MSLSNEQKSVSQKNCEKCGRSFECGAESGKPCWCFEYTLSSAALENLKAAYQQCLCPSCLKTFSEDSKCPPK